MVSGVGQPAAYALVVLAEDLRPRTGDPAVRAQVEQELAALLKQVNAQRGRLRAAADDRDRPRTLDASRTAA